MELHGSHLPLGATVAPLPLILFEARVVQQRAIAAILLYLTRPSSLSLPRPHQRTFQAKVACLDATMSSTPMDKVARTQITAIVEVRYLLEEDIFDL